MENKGSKFFKKGSAFLIAPALFSSFLPGTGASTVGGAVASKAASEGVISKLGSGVVKLLSNHWGKLVLLVGAGLLAWWLCSSNKSDEFPGLGKHINQYNDNNNENNINNDINNNYLNNNDANVANQDLRNLYRQKLDEYKKTLTVDIASHRIKNSSGAFFRYEWVFVKGCCLIKLSKFWDEESPSREWPVYIFPDTDKRVFGFLDISLERDFSRISPPSDLVNFVRFNGFLFKSFDKQLFSTESVGNCSDKLNLFEQDRFKSEKLLDEDEKKQIALFELIRDNDPNFWSMRNNPALIQQDIQNHQQLKQQQGIMAMNDKNMFNMGNMQQQMMQPNCGMPIQENNQGFNYNMPLNNNTGNNNMMDNNMSGNNQAPYNQGMGMNGFQGNNNVNPQQMGMNNQQNQGQYQPQQQFYNNGGGNNFNNNNFNNNMMPLQQPPYGNNNNFNNN